jgi:23S rRNA (adenine2503-C2)-methyltransferase
MARGAESFSAMSDLPRAVREDLDRNFTIYAGSVEKRISDPDGTTKIRIVFPDGARIESVLLVDASGRNTACLSTQSGCPLGCVFCKTGRLGLHRNLTAAEIVEQLFHLRLIEPDIANIVFMGMGEPLLNFDSLRQAIELISHDSVFSPRRITVSTAGIVPGIRNLGDSGLNVRLAFSLTTAEPVLRNRLMPVTAANPVPDVKESLLYFQHKTRRRITLEAVLLRGINTRTLDAQSIVEFARGLDVVLNVIPWNPVPGLDEKFHAPSGREIAAFTGYLKEKGLNVTRRFPRGTRVAGACGQLGADPT